MEFVTRAGEEVPAVGLGTWQMEVGTAEDAVSTGLDLGYRHVDTAQAYGNEQGVGRAIAEADVPREEVFLTTKVHPSNRSVDSIVASVEESLDRLGVESVVLSDTDVVSGVVYECPECGAILGVSDALDM